MGTFDLQRHSIPGAFRRGSLRTTIARAAATWRRERAIRATCAALERLDNAQLRDLGIYRSEIWSIAIRTADAHPDRRSACVGVAGTASVAILALILAIGLELVFVR